MQNSRAICPESQGTGRTYADLRSRPAHVSVASQTSSGATGPAQAAVAFGNRPIIRAYFSENPWDNLHAQPTIIVVAISAVLSLVSTYVLQHHVIETKDHIGVFLFGSYLVFSSYFVAYYFLQNYSSSFRKISEDKKFYTIANLMKAGLLAALTPFAVTHLYRITRYDEWDTNTLRNLGCIYAIPDFVSMIVVRRMAWTTYVHHFCVCLFNYFSIQNDYNSENICRLIVVYAAFSTFAYCVNMLLASRFLGVSHSASRVLSFVALSVYVLCCALNWTWQVLYLRRLLQDHRHWTVYLYMFLICFVMYDDMILNKWLLQNARSSGVSLVTSSARQQQ